MRWWDAKCAHTFEDAGNDFGYAVSRQLHRSCRTNRLSPHGLTLLKLDMGYVTQYRYERLARFMSADYFGCYLI